MEKQIWKIGDPCFITDICLIPGSVRMEILPALITREGNRYGADAIGESISNKQSGKIIIAGTPFRTEEAARAWIQDYILQICRAGEDITITGSRPVWNIPEELPSIGDIVYIVDIDEREIIEVQVGLVRFESAQLEIGYDPSPNNVEVNCIRMNQWWKTREEIEVRVRENYGDGFTFVSKEEHAARADAAIAEMWSDSEEPSEIFG